MMLISKSVNLKRAKSIFQVPATLDTEWDNQKLSDFPNVWKVFSQAPLSKKEINDAFMNIVETKKIEDIYIANWLAYPEYTVGQKEAKSAYFRY